MPKILINEKDKTLPGSASSYSNFSVLVAGYVKSDFTKYDADTESAVEYYENNGLVKPDSNDVFEFNSADKFEKTIGLVAPYNSVKGYYHYGNQMAYELLNMGYSVIYKPIYADTEITALGNSDFWEVFKDKASYDFRFITHGFLESSGAKAEDITEQANTNTRRELLASVKEQLETIAKDASIEFPENKDDNGIDTNEAERLDYISEAYETLHDEAVAKNNDSLIDKSTIGLLNRSVDINGNNVLTDDGDIIGTGSVYSEYDLAVDGVDAEIDALDKKLAYLKDVMDNTGISSALIKNANNAIAALATYIAAGTGNTTYNAFDGEEAYKPNGRGDCVALIELDEKLYTNKSLNQKAEALIIESLKTEMDFVDGQNGTYCALTVPSVYYKKTKEANDPFDNNAKFPGAFHYLACFMNSLKLGFAEWYAAAGYTRGVSSKIIDHTSVKLGEVAINALEPRNLVDDENIKQPPFACNVIANFRGSYYLWGNRTCHRLGRKGDLTNGDLVARSFLNIRQLCTTIKKQLYVACRRFTFDPNSDTLWVNFCNAIRPTLEAMKADQGIRDFKIVKEYTDKKATLKAKIRIIPIEAVEDFDLEVSLEDSFGETAAVVTE